MTTDSDSDGSAEAVSQRRRVRDGYDELGGGEWLYLLARRS